MKFIGMVMAEYEDDTMLVLVTGLVVKGHRSEMFREALARAAGPNVRKVMIDLGGVAKIDAAGIGLIAFYHAEHETRGIRQELVRVPLRIQEMLDITGLTRIFSKPASPEKDAA